MINCDDTFRLRCSSQVSVSEMFAPLNRCNNCSWRALHSKTARTWESEAACRYWSLARFYLFFWSEYFKITRHGLKRWALDCFAVLTLRLITYNVCLLFCLFLFLLKARKIISQGHVAKRLSPLDLGLQFQQMQASLCWWWRCYFIFSPGILHSTSLITTFLADYFLLFFFLTNSLRTF